MAKASLKKAPAKAKAAEAPKPATRKPVPPAAPKPDFGVAYLAEQLGIQALTVRNKLRDAGVPKKGRSYDFTKKEADDLVKKFKSAPAAEPKAKAKKKADAEE